MSDVTHIRFGNNLDSIATSLIRAFGLRHNKYYSHLSSPMLRWLDFRLRYIDPQPRKVWLSDQFPKTLPSAIGETLLRLVARLSDGEDINQHQGKGLTLHHDTSGEKKDQRTDLLWAEWCIHHLHLSAPASHEVYAERSDWLLFCVVLEQDVLLIDVLPHETDNFSDTHLIETLFRNWPALAKQYELKGLLAGDSGWKPRDIANLRKAGVTVPFTYEGRVYMGPGMGITTASTSLRVGMVGDFCMHYVRQLAQYVNEPSCQFREHPIIRKIDKPNFELALTPQGIAVYEEKSNIAWPLPRRATCGDAYYLGALHDNILPDWVLRQISNALIEAK